MTGRYILDGKTPIEEPDLLTWGAWFEGRDNRRVAATKWRDVWISTVFLGLDHSFTGGTPILFETMIFGGPADQHQWRCATWAEAEAQHAHAVERAHAHKNRTRRRIVKKQRARDRRGTRETIKRWHGDVRRRRSAMWA